MAAKASHLAGINRMAPGLAIIAITAFVIVGCASSAAAENEVICGQGKFYLRTTQGQMVESPQAGCSMPALYNTTWQAGCDTLITFSLEAKEKVDATYQNLTGSLTAKCVTTSVSYQQLCLDVLNVEGVGTLSSIGLRIDAAVVSDNFTNPMGLGLGTGAFEDVTGVFTSRLADVGPPLVYELSVELADGADCDTETGAGDDKRKL
eukprot:jgi/Mesvir1/6488/Mv16760-RA.1